MRTVRTLAVPTFKNKTYEPRVEVLLADTLIKTLQEDGTYTIVSDDIADAILNCTLNRIERRSLRSVQNNVLATAEFGLFLDIAYQVSDRVTGSLLKKGKVTGKRPSSATPIFRRLSVRPSRSQPQRGGPADRRGRRGLVGPLLTVVPTPIGNLQDITLRALQALAGSRSHRG